MAGHVSRTRRGRLPPVRWPALPAPNCADSRGGADIRPAKRRPWATRERTRSSRHLERRLDGLELATFDEEIEEVGGRLQSAVFDTSHQPFQFLPFGFRQQYN